MRQYLRPWTCLMGLVLVAGGAAAAPQPQTTPLSATGETLKTQYAAMLANLREEIAKGLPRIDEGKKRAFLKACQDEAAAAAALAKAQSATEAKDPKTKEQAGIARKAAEEALAKAQANALQAGRTLLAEVEPFLGGEAGDARLVKCAVLAGATPRGLAEFAQQDKAHEALVEKLLADDGLMKQMLVAGGAKYGKYGQAMQIYAAIQKASPKAGEGVFQRLALATSLEHAVPIGQSNPKEQADAPAAVDPVKRYLHYEKAYIDGELDPAFKNLSVWEYRMVVNCDAPDTILAWGREMLRNYRPDLITTPNTGWRYSMLVRTDVKYGSENVKDDLDSSQQYQNIIKDGGVCGRRAFFGRFLLRSFGIPVYGMTYYKHAALSRWTPTGWVANLGAAMKWGWWDKNETPRGGADFLLETQARAATRDYMKVLRAQWISSALGEQAYNDRRHVAGDLWSAVAHAEAQAIATAAKATAPGAVGTDDGQPNESKEKAEQAKLTDADRPVRVDKDGAITIPAVAYVKPKANTAQFVSMRGYSGVTQLHCVSDFKDARELEYAFDAPAAGRYALVAWVVTVQENQKFLVAANDSKEPVELAVPYTIGMWRKTEPIQIMLVKGQNVLHVTREAGSRGVTIKDFVLTPVK